MSAHEPTDTEALVVRLERQARWLTLTAAIQGIVSGGVLGWLVGPYFGSTPTIMAIVFAAAGALFGFSQGRARQASLQIEAAHIRMLAQIDRNTRTD